MFDNVYAKENAYLQTSLENILRVLCQDDPLKIFSKFLAGKRYYEPFNAYSN